MTLLNKQELKQVRKLASNHCSNYMNGGCIFGGACSYDKKTGGSVSCNYFEQSVLPIDKPLEQAYREAHGLDYVEKSIGKFVRTCRACEESFHTDSKNILTCSDECRKHLRSLTNKRYRLRHC